MSVLSNILALSKQLLPTGQAFRAKLDSNEEKLFRGLAISEDEADNAVTGIKSSLIPDNDAFTEDDATDWERRLDIYGNASIPLATRKATILRKMAEPGVNPAKAHYLRLQQELQDAGFNVYVYENIFHVYPGLQNYTYSNPAIWNGNILSEVYLDDYQLGDIYLDKQINNIAARYLDLKQDVYWSFGADQASTFFIGAGPGTLGTYATIPGSRREEFRQLLLSLKQPQDIGILFINY